MVKIPKLKRKISSFLSKEDGKISKDKLVKTGILMGIIAIGANNNVKGHTDVCPADGSRVFHPENGHGAHCNTLGNSYSDPTAAGTHSQGHTNHASHASHGSHGSHNSW